MLKELKQGILFIAIIVILPILASFIVEIITSIVTMEMIIKVVYLMLCGLIIYFAKEGI